MSMNTFYRIHALICHENLFLSFNQIIYKNAADTRICNLAFLWMLYYTSLVLINRNVSTGYMDTSNAAYTS